MRCSAALCKIGKSGQNLKVWKEFRTSRVTDDLGAQFVLRAVFDVAIRSGVGDEMRCKCRPDSRAS